MSHDVLTIRHLSKRYGSVVALRDVLATFRAGEIHGLLGQNGAGKSTLVNCIGGFTVPDRGEILFEDKPLPLGRPHAVRQAGIGMVHQHFTLVPEFSVADNLALAASDGPYRTLDVKRMAAPALDRARSLGWIVDADARAGSLPVGSQQRIEILKALATDARVLLLDEPTAVLSPDEVDDLFHVLRALRESGVGVVLIAHKLREVLAVADRVTVLRDGAVVAEAPIGEVDAGKLAQWMVGEMPETLVERDPRGAGESVATVRDLRALGDRGEEAVRGVSFEVRRGAVFGIGGVDGNGQVELAEALAGIRPASGGGVTLPSGGAAYIPQDPQRDGLALRMSVAENLLLGSESAARFRRGPFMAWRAVLAWARGVIERFAIRAESERQPAGALSGGNQQKVVVARALESDHEVVVAVNPTRGLDIRATADVRARLRSAADSGRAVVLLSTDLDELEELADEVRFLSGGRFAEGLGREALLGGGC